MTCLTQHSNNEIEFKLLIVQAFYIVPYSSTFKKPAVYMITIYKLNKHDLFSSGTAKIYPSSKKILSAPLITTDNLIEGRDSKRGSSMKVKSIFVE